MRAQTYKFDWPKLALELGIVFVGVLLALAVNEWVTSRHERAEEEVLLRDVRTEFQAIIKDMDHEIVFRNAMTKNTGQIYALAEKGARPDGATMDSMVANLWWWSSAYLATGVVDSILVGGKLRLIQSNEIRYFLAALPARLASIKQVEENDYVTLRDVTVPYFMKNGDMSQILAAMSSERPGSTEKGELTFEYHPRVPRDHAELLNDTEFLNVVGNVYASQENVVYAYEELKPDLERMIGLIDAELAD